MAGNTASGNSGNGGNLASNFSGHLNVENSIVAYGTALANGDGCHVSSGGTLISSGRNIDTGSSCAFGAAHLSNTDPLLLPPGSNGGPTPTLLPAATSPAINAAIGCPTPATDQRGVVRPQGAACDIGAVELVPASGGGEPPALDLVAPIISDFSISARRFRTARNPPDPLAAASHQPRLPSLRARARRLSLPAPDGRAPRSQRNLSATRAAQPRPAALRALGGGRFAG